MKKFNIVLLLIVTVCVLLLSACQENSNDIISTTAPTTSTTTKNAIGMKLHGTKWISENPKMEFEFPSAPANSDLLEPLESCLSLNAPEYDITITDNDGNVRKVKLWLQYSGDCSEDKCKIEFSVSENGYASEGTIKAIMAGWGEVTPDEIVFNEWEADEVFNLEYETITFKRVDNE